jgi:hypothetical protein
MEETGVRRENHRPAANNWQTLSHHFVHLDLSWIRTISVVIDTDGMGRYDLDMIELNQWVLFWLQKIYVHFTFFLNLFVDYMEDFCKYQISIEEPIILSLTKNMFYDHGYRCSVQLKGPRNHVLSLQFTRFDVGQPHMIFCDDSLHIYDGK